MIDTTISGDQMMKRALWMQTISGLFSWLWVASWIATIVFAVRAIAYSGSWWYVAISFVAVIFSKGWAKEYLKESRLYHAAALQLASDPNRR